MRKKLRLDDLAVESFEAGEPMPMRGTVRANESGGAACTAGCSFDGETCGCASLRYQRECQEVTNDTCVGCGSGSDPTLEVC